MFHDARNLQRCPSRDWSVKSVQQGGDMLHFILFTIARAALEVEDEKDHEQWKDMADEPA